MERSASRAAAAQRSYSRVAPFPPTAPARRRGAARILVDALVRIPRGGHAQQTLRWPALWPSTMLDAVAARHEKVSRHSEEQAVLDYPRTRVQLAGQRVRI